MHRFRRLLLAITSFERKSHDHCSLLPRAPGHVWIAANSRRSPARKAHKGSGRVHSSIPGQPREDSLLLCPLRRTAQPMPTRRRAGNRKSSVTATSGLPPAPTGGLLARRGIAIARLGTTCAQAHRPRPWPPDWTRPIIRSCPEVTPGLERAKVYLGLVSGTRSYTQGRSPDCDC